MKSEIRIIIADDHPVFRRGLQQVIESTAGMKIIAEAEDGLTALDLIEQHKPDVALLDLNMPRMDGFEVVRAMREKRIQTETIFVTVHKDEDLFNEAMGLEVKGYVLKNSAVTDIVGSIRAVTAGQNFISPELSTYLLSRSRRAASLVQHKPGVSDLTPSERRILKMVAEDKTSKEIAEELFISHRTVEAHRANISKKLDLHGSLALIRFAVAHKAEL